MPYLDYRCNNCNDKYVYFHHGSHDKIPQCPKCASRDAEKLISLHAGHILKGDGWARDNYKTKPIKK